MLKVLGIELDDLNSILTINFEVLNDLTVIMECDGTSTEFRSEGSNLKVKVSYTLLKYLVTIKEKTSSVILFRAMLNNISYSGYNNDFILGVTGDKLINTIEGFGVGMSDLVSTNNYDRGLYDGLILGQMI